MQRKSLLAALLAAIFALPLAAQAGNDKAVKATSGSDGGAEAMFKSMDKNGDGFISKEEAKGTPHAAEFAQLDKNGDGKLSPEEHAAAPEHVAARSGASPAGSTTTRSVTNAERRYSSAMPRR